ncbi:hypothetical protein L7F22_016128 [Adiantum nelumboides]|nr:hypothetical protein [Adiantum nelumboides]
MLGESVKPSLVTFIIILNACSIMGLSKESETYFENMSKDYGIAPAPHHYTCLIDLHSRVGKLDEAVSKINQMPWESNFVTWHAVIEASKYFGNFDFANRAFELATSGKFYPQASPAFLDDMITAEALRINEA